MFCGDFGEKERHGKGERWNSHDELGANHKGDTVDYTQKA